VITAKPVPWGPLPEPYTLAGDRDWTDYAVAADVRFLSSAPAVVMGRIDSADVFQDGDAHWPTGYILRVRPDGRWDLNSAAYNRPTVTLASGSVTLDRSQWHRLELRFRGAKIQAFLDGTQLTSVDDSAHAHGMFGLGTEWDRIQFDNLSVTP
jgi:galactosylceramidase